MAVPLRPDAAPQVLPVQVADWPPDWLRDGDLGVLVLLAGDDGRMEAVQAGAVPVGLRVEVHRRDLDSMTITLIRFLRPPVPTEGTSPYASLP